MSYMDIDSSDPGSDYIPTSESDSESSSDSLDGTSSSSDVDVGDYHVHSADDDSNSVEEHEERNNSSTDTSEEDIADQQVSPAISINAEEQNERNSPLLESVRELHSNVHILNVSEPIVGSEMDGNKDSREVCIFSPPKASLDKSMDDDGQTCPICFEPWTNSSDHRLVSLKCGHLFGQSCIYKWLKGHKAAKCPQCNTSAKRSDIRKLYVKNVKVLDTSERDKALEKLEKESKLRCKLQIECTQLKLKYQMSTQECERLKKELIEAKSLMHELRSNSRANEKSSQSCQSHSEFILSKNIEVNKQGGCRVVDVSGLLGMFVVSQPSANNLFKGYGFRKISTLDFKSSEFVYVHQKAIKDVAFHEHDSLVLSASLDGTVKMTNILNNSIVQSYSLKNDVWSCTWNKNDLRYFYAGVKNGSVLLFDMRKTDSHVCQLPHMGCTSPVVAVEHLPMSCSGSHSKNGLLIGHLSICYFCEMLHDQTSYRTHPLPLEGSFTSLNCEGETGHFLASCRPSAKNKQVTHSLCALSYDESSPVPYSCDIIQTMCGGKTQVQLAKSKVFPHPDDNSCVLICSGDEDAQGALVWNGSTGECFDTLKAESPVLDLTAFKINHQSMLATLTEKNLRFYSWTTSR